MIHFLLAIACFLCVFTEIKSQQDQISGQAKSVATFHKTFPLEWRPDYSLPLVRIAWTMSTRRIRPEVLFMLVQYTRMHRAPDSLPMRIAYRSDLPERVIWEVQGYASNLDVLLHTLHRDVREIEFSQRRLAFTLMQIEKHLDQPRTAAEWFLQQELQPVVWGREADYMQQVPSYRQLRRVQVEDLVLARNLLLADSTHQYIGTGPFEWEVVHSKLLSFVKEPLSIDYELNQAEEKFPETNRWPCDTNWISLQEDAGSPLVVQVWLWPLDSLDRQSVHLLQHAARWLESNQSTFHREWITTQRLYQARFQVLEGKTRLAWLSYVFPRLDQVEDARDLVPDALQHCLKVDRERMYLSWSVDHPTGNLEDPWDWMELVCNRMRRDDHSSFDLLEVGRTAEDFLANPPCIVAVLSNSKQARQAGIEPDESGQFIVPAEPEVPVFPLHESFEEAEQLPDSLEAGAFPSDLLADVVIYFDSRYPEIRDERLQQMDQVIEALRQYPEARLVIYGSVVNRREINSDLIGKMWAEYIRDFLVQQRRFPTERILPQAGLLLDQPHISRRWDRRISFQLISN